MAGFRTLRPGRRKQASAPLAPPPSLPPLPRAPVVVHHWLSLAVVRPGPSVPIPVAGARVVVRPFPRGAERPEDPVARGSTNADGVFALSLPRGRYAVYAQHMGEGKAVNVTLEHDGRATLVLESLSLRTTLTIEAIGIDGRPLAEAPVEVRALPGGAPIARASTGSDGACRLHLPPGAYEVHVPGATTRTYFEADTTIRLTSDPRAPESAEAIPDSRYAQRVRAATSEMGPLDQDVLRDETWN